MVEIEALLKTNNFKNEKCRQEKGISIHKGKGFEFRVEKQTGYIKCNNIEIQNIR